MYVNDVFSYAEVYDSFFSNMLTTFENYLMTDKKLTSNYSIHQIIEYKSSSISRKTFKSEYG